MNDYVTARLGVLERNETMPNRVEFSYRGKKRFVAFDEPGAAYRFWIGLRRGTYATLYQDGKETGRGTGLESGL